MTDKTKNQDENRGTTYHELRASFTEAARPLMKWLNENVHPHHQAVVTGTCAELTEGCISTGQILDYVKD